MYRYILRESCSQFDSLPLTSLTIFLTRLEGLLFRREAPPALVRVSAPRKLPRTVPVAACVLDPLSAGPPVVAGSALRSPAAALRAEASSDVHVCLARLRDAARVPGSESPRGSEEVARRHSTRPLAAMARDVLSRVGDSIGAEARAVADVCSVEDIVRACVAVGANCCDCGAAASLLIATTAPNAARGATRRFALLDNGRGSGSGSGKSGHFRALSEAMRSALQIVRDALTEGDEHGGASTAPHGWRWSPSPHPSALSDAARFSAARHAAPADARRFFVEFASRLGAIAVGAACSPKLLKVALHSAGSAAYRKASMPQRGRGRSVLNAQGQG